VLYAVEGYKHAEIATMFYRFQKVPQNRQLFKARRILQAEVKRKLKGIGYGTN